MKKQSKNYRKIYKDFFGIDFSSKYVIHHIDLNRQNNDIQNLLLLPRALHGRYHHLIQRLSLVEGYPTVFPFNMQIRNQLLVCCDYTSLDELYGVLLECSKWIDYKNYLLGRMPNVHGIELE